MFDSTNHILNQFWVRLSNSFPEFVGGLLLILVGYLVAASLKRFLIALLHFFRVDSILHKTGLITQKEVKLWINILAELTKWTVVILFMIPALEAWGLSRATAVLNQFLFYIPNVIVAVVIGFVGIVVANLSSDLVLQSAKSAGESAAHTLSVFAKSSILFFTILIILNQLGVAQDLIRIFFTGLVAMIALAGGLAFGLGGKDHAKELLDELKRKISQ